jgi:hypothetical protein
MKRLHRFHPALMLLSCAIVASCASNPPVPVVVQGPKFPEPPPSLMTEPRSSSAQTRLLETLRSLVETVNLTPLP